MRSLLLLPVAVAALLAAPEARAAGYREAPFVAENPKVDGTDLFAFRSFEAGRDDFVTLVADYQPLQDAFAGPGYFVMDPDAIYEIHVDNDGDGVEDLTFRFDFAQALQGGGGLTCPSGRRAPPATSRSPTWPSGRSPAPPPAGATTSRPTRFS